MSESESILIIGASARSAANSAICGDVKPSAIDLFGDLDLCNSCFSQTIDTLSVADIGEIHLDELPENFVITGGMEGRPELLRWLCRTKKLLGPSISSIEKTNDVFLLQEICRNNSVPFPVVFDADKSNDLTGNIVAKPVRSTGGFRVKDWCGIESLGPEFYLQRYVSGDPMSSVFCATDNTVELVGTTRQLTGTFMSNPNKYCYCGSIGPIDFSDSMTGQIRRVGEVLACELQLIGLFGLDWILDEQDRFCLIEINPRWTASCEVFERQGAVGSLLKAHIEAICRRRPPKVVQVEDMCGKLIVFNSNQKIRVDNDFVARIESDNIKFANCRYADIPNAGTVIDSGAPVLTVFSEGESLPEIEQSLKKLNSEIQSQLMCLEIATE